MLLLHFYHIDMQIISGITEIQINSPTAVAIGKFDGVHLGHKQLLREITEKAHSSGVMKSVVFTFNPSPESLFSGIAFPELTTISEKRKIFDRMGIDILIEFPMNFKTASIPADVFLREYLCDRLNARYIVAGRDLSFGESGSGNADLLCALAGEYGYECHIIDKLKYKGADISSTRIREAIVTGDIVKASEMIGEPYRITGVVSHGRHVGSSLGMPTANVIIPPDKLTGPRGVYYSRVHTLNGIYRSISNLGVKPTVAEDELLCCESYIYDFNDDIYGQYIEVELLDFVRPERKFDSIEELKEQMNRDIRAGDKYSRAQTKADPKLICP